MCSSLKTVRRTVFLTLRPSQVRLLYHISIKIAVPTEVETAILVGVTGVEPAASCSQSKRATICATPRFIFIFAYNLSFSYSVTSRLRFLLQYSRLTRLERFVILLIAPLLFPRFIRHRRRSETSPSALHPDLYLFLLIIPHLATL